MFIAGIVHAQSSNEAGLYNSRCAVCHGQHGNKVNQNMSVAIDTLSKEEIVVRLALVGETDRKSAGDRAKASLSSEQTEAVADYIVKMGQN